MAEEGDGVQHSGASRRGCSRKGKRRVRGRALARLKSGRRRVVASPINCFAAHFKAGWRACVARIKRPVSRLHTASLHAHPSGCCSGPLVSHARSRWPLDGPATRCPHLTRHEVPVVLEFARGRRLFPPYPSNENGEEGEEKEERNTAHRAFLFRF